MEPLRSHPPISLALTFLLTTLVEKAESNAAALGVLAADIRPPQDIVY